MTTSIHPRPAGRERAVATPRADRRERRRYLRLNGASMVMIATIALSIIGILYLVQTSQVAQLGYQLSRLQKQHDELALENARIGYEIARYESIEKVQQVAIERLGMTPLKQYRFLTVQRPAQENLPTLPPEQAPPPPVWQRALDALRGIGHAHAPTEPAATATTSGEPMP